MSRPAMLLASALAALCASCTTRVVGGLDEQEANRVITALEQAGIPASKSPERRSRKEAWAVRVPSADGPRAREILDGLSLPRPTPGGFSGIVDEESIVPSSSRERLKENVARGQEIASTLETLDGVLAASVILAPADPPVSGWSAEPRGEGTASALLKVSGKMGISEQDVRNLVAGATPGVEPGGVAVVIEKGPATGKARVPWSRVGPFVVSPSSRQPLIASLASMALLNILLGGWAVASVVRSVRRRRRPPPG